MRVRSSNPEPRAATDPPVVVEAERPGPNPTRRGARRWLVPFLLASLAVHLLGLLVYLLMPPSRSGVFADNQAASPSEITFEMAPAEPTHATPPQAPDVTDATPTPPPPAASPQPMPQPEPAPPEPAPPVPAPPVPAPPVPQAVPPPPPPAPEPPPAVVAPPPPPPPPLPPPPRPVAPRPVAPRPPVPAVPSPAPPRPLAQQNTGDYFFAPPAPRSSRQAQGRTRGPLDLSIGPAENYRGDPPRRNPNDRDSEIQVTGAQLGGDWEKDLKRWWIEHRRYPQQAIEQNEQGTVVIRFKVNRIGQVSGAEIVSRSGSQWLDMQAMATFGHARLPPFPTNTPENEATLTLTINFVLTH